MLLLESGFLESIQTGVLYGDCGGFIILFLNNLSTCFVISDLSTGGNLYCLEKIREFFDTFFSFFTCYV